MNRACLVRLGGMLGPPALGVLACGSQPTGGCPPGELADIAQGIGGFVIDGEDSRDYAGLPVSGVGDINGDGLADVAIGARRAYPNGRAYVVFGKADTDAVSLADVAQGEHGFPIDGEETWPLHRLEVTRAGDVNRDGVDDLLVSAPWADANGIPGSGRSYVVFGHPGIEAVSLPDVAQGVGGFAMDGETEHGYSGVSLSNGGDVNGDGFADVLLVAPGPGGHSYYVLEGPRRTYVVFGKADTNRVALADVAQGSGGFIIEGEVSGDDPGSAAANAGDVNGDDLSDVLVGTWEDSWWRPDHASRTHVVFGKTDTEAVLLTDVARGTGGFIVDGVAGPLLGLGDMNGDGLGDVLAGLYFVFGKTDTDNVMLEDLERGRGGFFMDTNFGVADVSGAGDLDGDGLSDMVMGASRGDPRDDGYTRIYFVFGKSGIDHVDFGEVARGIGGFALENEAEWDYAGVSVSGAGDVNGDGIDDAIVGAYRAEVNGGSDTGRTYVVFGGSLSCDAE